MSKLIAPAVPYSSALDLKQTELAIKYLKDFFQGTLSSELKLRRVTAPLFVLKGTGINDNLNGVERPVTFGISDMGGSEAEVVHSLAKWKRKMLAEYKIEKGYGIYTDMNAIRADEELDNTHSLYVDQWDWEMTIAPEDRSLSFLKDIVRRIYSCMLRSEFFIYEMFPSLKPQLPREIHFVHSQQLLDMYPGKTPKEREDLITKQYGAVFIIGIGGELSDGRKHDGRSPDYDDWTSENEDGFKGLNGDILVWDELLGHSLELSSMGVRVDKAALLRQLKICGAEDRLQYAFHKSLIDGTLPQSLGGGIGQSRLCMFMLHKAHVGEIQSSIWPDDMRSEAAGLGIYLL